MRTILENFSKVKILVVGDAMIDRYWWGDATRISPEAPVPVVRLKRESSKPGGAANVAANVVGLGAQVRLISAVGDDREGKELSDILDKNGVDPQGLTVFEGMRTTVKTRIIAHNQHVVRLDTESASALNLEQEKEILRKINDSIEWADVVLISDYAKGFLNENILQRLITKGNAKAKIVLADPKGQDYLRYRNASILTPNLAETAQASRIEITDRKSLEKAAAFLLASLNLNALLVTRGENGMTLFEKNASTADFPATARSVYDVTGAGDTVIATFAVAHGAGADLQNSAQAANAAAGLVVQEVGTTAVSFEKLAKALAV